MDIKYDDLTQILARHSDWAASGVSPRQALHIDLSANRSKCAKSEVFETGIGGSVVVEFDENGVVIGLEFV